MNPGRRTSAPEADARAIRRVGRSAVAALIGVLTFSLGAAARAQASAEEPPGGEPGGAASAVDEQTGEARKSEGRRHFERGLQLFDEEAWDAALAEFLRSRAAYPTRAATRNAALCLSRLRRFDEALDMFEETLRFPSPSEADRALAEQKIDELREIVGTLSIEGGEPGASLVVDGRYRGNLPLTKPIRVEAGIHEVRAYKEGFDPFGASVEVKGKQAAVARLQSLSTGGRIKVTEQRGRVLDVVLDGVLVGKTPWEGPAAVGEHLVFLRGNVPLDTFVECASGEPAARAARLASVDLGTQPVSVPVRLREVTRLTLTAEELDTSLRVVPTPAGATVAIDAVVVGRGTWEGRLRVGVHTVEVLADGFLTEARRLTLERRKRQTVAIELERDRNSPAWRSARNMAVGAAYGVGALGLGVFAVTGSLALNKLDDADSRCSGTLCPASEKPNIDAAAALGQVATIGLITGGIGVAAGTIILFATRPGSIERRSAAAGGGARGTIEARWRAGVGAGRIEVEARY